MQTLASYLLSTPQLTNAELLTRQSALGTLLEGWLADKGADLPLEKEGFFKSKTKADSTGVYRVDKYEAENGAVIEYTLEEKSKSGLNFRTHIAVLTTSSHAELYAALTVSNPADVVTQAFTDAKCPKVIRDAINLFRDWHCFDNPLTTSATTVGGGGEISAFAELITNKARKLPIVAVSDLDGEEIWPDTSSQIAHDLTGAAEVFHLSEDASSELTNAVGKLQSCYLVRPEQFPSC